MHLMKRISKLLLASGFVLANTLMPGVIAAQVPSPVPADLEVPQPPTPAKAGGKADLFLVAPSHVRRFGRRHDV